MVSDDITQLVESQQQNSEDVRSKSVSGQGDTNKTNAELRNNAAIFAFSLKQNPLATDNLEKVQEDR